MLYQKVLEEYHFLQSKIFEIREQLKTAPEGKLTCARGNNCYKWYNTVGHERTYISKSNRNLAEQLAIKKYLSVTLSQLEKEKTAIEFYLRHHADETEKAEDLLTNHPGYQDLLTPYFSPKSLKLQEWSNAPYERNMKHPENLVHRTGNGIYVRSKSEAMIALFLHTNRIPFRYECAISLGGATLYPDFTILHPQTEKVYYYEHFGMMDDAVYAKNAYSRLQLYAAYGIIPSIQLITTYETKEHPLSYEEISWVCSRYFL